jgi:hypothetical protein
MPMSTDTAVTPHEPSVGTSTYCMPLSRRKGSCPRGGDGVGTEGCGGGDAGRGSAGVRRTILEVDVGISHRARRLRGRDGGDGGRWRPCASRVD